MRSNLRNKCSPISNAHHTWKGIATLFYAQRPWTVRFDAATDPGRVEDLRFLQNNYVGYPWRMIDITREKLHPLPLHVAVLHTYVLHRGQHIFVFVLSSIMRVASAISNIVGSRPSCIADDTSDEESLNRFSIPRLYCTYIRTGTIPDDAAGLLIRA